MILKFKTAKAIWTNTLSTSIDFMDFWSTKKNSNFKICSTFFLKKINPADFASKNLILNFLIKIGKRKAPLSKCRLLTNLLLCLRFKMLSFQRTSLCKLKRFTEVLRSKWKISKNLGVILPSSLLKKWAPNFFQVGKKLILALSKKANFSLFNSKALWKTMNFMYTLLKEKKKKIELSNLIVIPIKSLVWSRFKVTYYP